MIHNTSVAVHAKNNSDELAGAGVLRRMKSVVERAMRE